MFQQTVSSRRELHLDQLRVLVPVKPGKVIGQWNNFMALAGKLKREDPTEVLYFIKASSSYLGPDEVIRQPASSGKIVFEGELGIVIGKVCKAVFENQAMDHAFGHTFANDVTHANIFNRDASFTQWVRAKSFDTYCPLGPAIATGQETSSLVVKTMLNGEVRQNYPISDMRFSVQQLVSGISGDIILCGTSVGVGSMKPGSRIEIEISGIGTLRYRFE